MKEFRPGLRTALRRLSLKGRDEIAWRRDEAVYRGANSVSRRFSRTKDVRIAIIVHLFYVESWSDIEPRLSLFQEAPFDLYVTMPEANVSFAETINNSFPSARIVVSPNRGRDVLPFLKLASELLPLGYEGLLKIHSKKSPHYDEGRNWFQSILQSLLPESSQLRHQIIETLKLPDTGLISPQGQYLSLPVNWAANSRHIENLVRGTNPDTFEKVLTNIEGWGFVAGTMFWARFDAIEPLLRLRLSSRDFEAEAGQIDGTMAHAVERALSLVPELNKKSVYGVEADKLVKLSYRTSNIPEWSELYHN